MTMPDERVRAVSNTRQFLLDLLDPKKTPRVPKAIRQKAYRCLRHYPGDFYLHMGKDGILNSRHVNEFEASLCKDAYHKGPNKGHCSTCGTSK